MASDSWVGRLVTIPSLRESRIVTTLTSGERLWAFFQASQGCPFAVDVRTGETVKFEIPGGKASGIFQIQSHVVIAHANAVILMISSGSPMPPEGKQIPWYWMSLKSGKAVALPITWRLSHFSADQLIAVFGESSPGMDVRTGEVVLNPSDRRSESIVPFHWTDNQRIRAITRRSEETGGLNNFAGLSLDGTVSSIDLGLNGLYRMHVGKANDGFAGFQLVREDMLAPATFWITPLSARPEPEFVSSSMLDFLMLGGGNCVFSCAGAGDKGASHKPTRTEELSSEAFYRIHKDRTQWNVLEGVERLHPLDKEYAAHGSIKDDMTVRLVEGWGSHPSDRLALCLFTHLRFDKRSGVGAGGLPLMKSSRWRRAVLVSSDGHRYMTDLFREGEKLDVVWLYNSGRVITGEYLWEASDRRKVRLCQTTLQVR